MTYSFNITKLIKSYLYPLFYQAKINGLLLAYLYPIVQKQSDFIAFKAQMDAQATINIQYNRMVQALRDKFGDNTIDIIHPGDYLLSAFIYLSYEAHSPEFDYLASESHTPVEYDYLGGEYGSTYHYIVQIPTSLATQSAQIYAFVNKYNLTSRRFAVQTI